MFIDRINSLQALMKVYDATEDDNSKQILSGFAFILENLPSADDALSKQNLLNLIDAGIEYAGAHLAGDFSNGMQKGFQIVKEIVGDNPTQTFIPTFISDHMDICEDCSYPIGEGFNYCPICGKSC